MSLQDVMDVFYLYYYHVSSNNTLKIHPMGVSFPVYSIKFSAVKK